jgi:aldehyde:ferredoxin oxidoreductase
MKETDNVAHRLALLAGVDLPKADLQSIANEIEDLERVVAELEEFAQATPWISQQVQPPGKKA